MAATQLSDAFDTFYREQAPVVFDLALRHGGDHTTAIACVDAVFAELSGHWGTISDPMRFARRAAVLFVCGSRRRVGHAMRLCRPGPRSRVGTRQPATMRLLTAAS
jgi:hypothetical protein